MLEAQARRYTLPYRDVVRAKIVKASLRRPNREVALDPINALGDVRPEGHGCRPTVGQDRRREVDRGDRPSARSQPEGL